MSMQDEKEPKRYQPYRDVSFYPGMHLSSTRRRQHDEYDLEPEDLTIDDIVFNLGRAWTRLAYSLFALMSERWGEQAAREVLREHAYRSGRSRFLALLRKHNLKRITPELMARFQDLSHALQGPNHATAIVEYSEDGLTLRRTTCGWHDGRPEGAQSICCYTQEGFFQAYKELDPDLEITVPACMSRGTSADHCEIRFRWKNT